MPRSSYQAAGLGSGGAVEIACQHFFGSFSLVSVTKQLQAPDFICIGAQKSGTSWLRKNLRAHSGIWMPPLGELHYFDETLADSPFPPALARERALDQGWRDAVLAEIQTHLASGNPVDATWWALYAFGDHNGDWYRALFSLAPPNCLTGEITPRYMLCGPDEIAHMRDLAARAKLLFLLRNPVDRFWSQCRMKYGNGTLEPGEGPAMYLFEGPNGRPRGLYSEAIIRFCEHFDPSQILLVFYDGIREQPDAVMKAVFEFLDLPPAPLQLTDLRQPVNESPSQEPIPSGLKARLEASYRRELEKLAATFGGYAESWLRPPDPGASSHAPAIRLEQTQLDQLRRTSRHTARMANPGIKFFCLSMQRSGTTSVGDWLEAHGLTRAGSPTARRLDWTRLWLEGKHETIFTSEAFEKTQIFEDDPWWFPGFFEVVAERFPEARFILLERDSDVWFDSMCHHNAGQNPGWSDVHARIYGREPDLMDWLQRHPDRAPDEWGLLSILGHREPYKAIYEKHYTAVREFFSSQPGRLFDGRLDDPEVFARICIFAGIEQNPELRPPHSNARTEAMRLALDRNR